MVDKLKSKLVFKLMGAIGITLCLGLAVLGATAISLQYNGALGLQTKNTRNLPALVINDLDGLMMKGESKALTDYIKETKERGFVLDLRIFDGLGKEVDSTVDGQDQDMARVLQTGKQAESRTVQKGVHTLAMRVPLPNEQRCQQCHDAGPKYLGGILLSTSVEDGYASAMSLTRTLVATGVVFFLVVLGCMSVFCRRIIVTHILEFLEQAREIGKGGGDLTRMITVRSSDEIGQLGVAINQLTSKLREIILQVSDRANRVAAAAHRLYSTSVQMSTNTESVAVETASVAGASEEMAATSTEIANNCIKVAESSKQASASAMTGSDVVERTIEVMNRIAGRVVDSARTVENLGACSTQIGQIISTIDDIADQTNLLALNAAIEAARAGEHGRGFAVVADEVRALAERTTGATKEISTMVTSIQKDTEEAVRSMEQGVTEVKSGTREAGLSGSALKEILEQVESVSMQVSQIASAADQQTATTRDITDNIQRVTRVVKDAALGLQESTAAASQLASLAEELQALAGQFKVI
jgi:methyl-accepting chemotaxis protein